MFETRPFKARFKSGIFFRIWLHARSARNSIPALQQPFDDLFFADAQDGLRRDEAGAQQTLRKQLRDATAAVWISLLSRQTMEALWVHQRLLELPWPQNIPDRLPIHAAGFHRRMCDFGLRQPGP